MNNARYLHAPIASIVSLSKSLGVEIADLEKVSENKDKFYIKTREIEKADGSKRITYDTKPLLKHIHSRIKENLFLNITYPEYLQGGLKGKDYYSNCLIHSGKKVIISEDITKFYDSIHEREVFKMWQYLFKFPKEVSEILTSITTYKGFVPQGAITSSYISNLIFWDNEPELYEWLRKKGLTYTRYIDDISISCNHYLPKKVVSQIISRIIRMFGEKGVRINRRKHNLATPSIKMQLHRVNISSRKPTLPQKERSEIRSLVKKTESMYTEKKGTEEYKKFYNSVSGKVGQLTRFHKVPGRKLRDRLRNIKPSSE